MKARVKATGRTIHVMNVMDEKGNGVWEEISNITNHVPQYSHNELEFLDIPKGMQKEKSVEPDYWEKLKHQYTGMAMQGILANPEMMSLDDIDVAAMAIRIANITISKLKEVEK